MRTIRQTFQYDNNQIRQIGLFLLIMSFLFTGHPGYAIEISDSPMATQIQKAPPNIMFVIDNSGSMDWSFMVAGENGGLWRPQAGGTRYYVFDNPGDNAPGIVLSGNERAEWQSQWSGSNKVYFNQLSNYKPWPHPTQNIATEGIDRMADADPVTPISNPYFLISNTNADMTLNMTDVYYTVPRPVHAEVIVDNQDGAPSFTTTGTWAPSPNRPEWNGDSLYTNTVGDTATFTPNLPESSPYEVSAWWNCATSMDDNAKVTVNSTAGTDEYYMDQEATIIDTPEAGICGEWIPIDTFDFQAGTGGSVVIARHGGSTGSHTVADAIKFEEVAPSEIVIHNAHYYAQQWDDANDNSIKDAGELTNYLVNYNVATGARDVYEIDDLNANNIIDDSDELAFYGNELPEPIRPAIYDNDGIFVEFRDAASELQNFANWYSYYRRRELSAKAAIGEVIAKSKEVQVGFYSLHDHNGGATRQVVLPVRVPGKTDGTSTLLTNLYMMDSKEGTPLRTSLENVGRYFDATDGDLGDLGSSPYYSAANGGACQHSFAIVMTDGFWNGPNPGVENADGAEGAPYADNRLNTLADVAMYYYKRDLSSTLDNELPSTECDHNNQQHMVTFSVSFGLNGTLDIENIYHGDAPDTPDIKTDFDNDGNPDGLSYKTDPCYLNANTPKPTWPEPKKDKASTIDDLWHAAVNGRGEFFSASDPEELVDALLAIFNQVEEVVASDASFTIDGDVISSNTKVFGPSYDSATWSGEVKAILFDEDGNLPFDEDGNIPDSEILWKASDQLMTLVGENGLNHTDRKIVTMHDGTGNGIPFVYGDLSNAQKTLLESDSNLLEYIRGRFNFPGFRKRQNSDLITNNVLGDIVHSSPVISPSGETIFVGANDGMLHAFDAETGVERFAYIPNLVFSNLAGLKETTFVHKFFVDATPTIWTVDNNETLLVGGLGKGGKGYYALDVTNADNYDPTVESVIASEIVKWEYPAPGDTDPDMGYSYSKPFIVKSNDNGRWVVIFGNGYNSNPVIANRHSILYVLDADTGVVLKKLDTGVGGDNGLSTPALIDLNNDNRVDFVYAGDLKGNMWKFDLTDPSPANWDVAFAGNALFQAFGPESPPGTAIISQPITTKPAVMKHPLRHGLMVLFGTGKFLGESDRINTDTQSLYGIWDFGDSDDEYLGSFLSRSALPGPALNSNVTLLLQERLLTDFGNDESQFLIHGDDGAEDDGVAIHLLRVTSDRDADWAVDSDTPFPNPAANANAGWYFDLPILGEQLIESPLIRRGIFIAVTTIPDSSYCSGGGWSIINEFDGLDGSRPAKPAFDVTGVEEVQELDAGGNIVTKSVNLINESDQIRFTDSDTGETVWAAATGILKPEGGILHLSESSIVELPGAAPAREKKILSSSVGKIQEVIELAPKRGIAFWREH